jgi:hypothetical protein
MGFGFLCNSVVPLDHLYKNPDIIGIIRKSDAWTTLDHLGPLKKKPTDMVGDFVMVEGFIDSVFPVPYPQRFAGVFQASIDW